MLGCKPCETSIDCNNKLKEDDGDRLLDVGRYQQLVEKLIYLALMHPDISFVVGMVSQFMHAPATTHLEAAYRYMILRYLKEDPSLEFLYTTHNPLMVEDYIDADWASSVSDWRSTSGYCTFVASNLVTWRSKKHVVARSSAKAKFWAMAHGICELIWIRGLLRNMGCRVKEPMSFHYDNKVVISIVHDPV